MKRTVIITLALLFAIIAGNAQTAKKNLNPAGTWSFEAPYAPEGYGTGTIVITEKDKAFGATIAFAGSEYKIPVEKVTVAPDTVTMLVYLDGADITIRLKPESETKLAGVALSPDGEIPLTLTKQVLPKK